jgi:hypothetical protein
MGIEPTSEAWEASILPLYDARSPSTKVDYTRPCDTDHSPKSPTWGLPVAGRLRRSLPEGKSKPFCLLLNLFLSFVLSSLS